MILITSGAYIDSSLAYEFGNIPPCMLPVQNKRLYEHQIELIRNQFGYDQNACLSGTKMYFLSDNKVITFDVLTAQFEELASFGDNLIITQFYRDPIGRLLFDGTNTKLETIRGEVLSDGTISFDIQELNYSVQIYYPINN